MGLSIDPLVNMPGINPEELALLKDQHFLKAKKQIEVKVTQLLLESQKSLIQWVETREIDLPDDVSLIPRKVAKGENYADMPYWVSDFPANMKGTDLWSFRTVVWWGNYISFSLIIAGKYKTAFTPFDLLLQEPDLYFTIAPSPWKLEFENEVVKPGLEVREEEIIQHFENHDFIKLSVTEKLENVNKLTDLTVVSFEKLIGTLGKLA